MKLIKVMVYSLIIAVVYMIPTSFGIMLLGTACSSTLDQETPFGVLIACGIEAFLMFTAFCFSIAYPNTTGKIIRHLREPFL